MVALKTETRIPAGLEAADLGEAVVATDGRSALISYVTSPIVVARENVYVLLVTDSALAASAENYAWSFTLDGGTPDERTTERGVIAYTPSATGNLVIAVRILDGGGSELGKLELTQDIVSPSAELETLIDAARNEQGPAVTNPDVARELVNEHNLYYQNAGLSAPEDGDGFKTFLFTMVHDGALEQAPSPRAQKLDQMAASLNGNGGDFATQAAGGFGVSAIRLGLLAMTTPPASGAGTALDWTELPEPAAPRVAAEATLRTTLGGLDEETRIDLFNRLRFPKSNITHCARILEALRDRYFPGTKFDDVLTGLEGTRAHWIVRHYREGPLVRT